MATVRSAGSVLTASLSTARALTASRLEKVLDVMVDAEEKAEAEALEPLDKIMREFQDKCEPPEGELDKIAEKRMERDNAARERKERKRAGD